MFGHICLGLKIDEFLMIELLIRGLISKNSDVLSLSIVRSEISKGKKYVFAQKIAFVCDELVKTGMKTYLKVLGIDIDILDPNVLQNIMNYPVDLSKSHNIYKSALEKHRKYSSYIF